MLNNFLSELDNERHRKNELYKQFLDDSFIRQIQTKFISLNIKNNELVDPVHVQSGGLDETDTSDKSDTSDTSYFDVIYRKINDLLNVLKGRSYDLSVHIIRDMFFINMGQYLGQVIDLTDSQYLLYTSLSNYHKENPFFPNQQYQINKIINTTSINNVVIINLTAKESSVNSEAITALLRHIIDNNVAPGGNMVIYYFFEPWVETNMTNVLEYFSRNFEEVTVLFPSVFLPISNKCFYVCRKKLEYSSNYIIDTNIRARAISFSKQITYHILNNVNILISLINFKIESESTFQVVSNKIKTHINSLPLIQSYEKVRIIKS